MFRSSSCVSIKQDFKLFEGKLKKNFNHGTVRGYFFVLFDQVSFLPGFVTVVIFSDQSKKDCRK